VIGVIESPEQEIITAEKILPYMEYVKGMIKLEEGMVIILHNLDKDKLLSSEEEKIREDKDILR
jgi:chemotaxis signal transduction protein